MNWVQRIISRLTTDPAPDQPGRLSPLQRRESTRRIIVETITLGVMLRDGELEILDHCALVAGVCSVLAEEMGVPVSEAYVLERAAALHELGMFTVPPSLLLRPGTVTGDELDTIRAQARVSAELAAPMHHPRVVRLIETQYDDYSTLRRRLPEPDLLLAGILRVADTIAATLYPRPYQEPLAPDARADLLVRGAGTRFHPEVVQHAIALGEERVLASLR